ncbi:hypothetical protein [Patulibacter sp. SYSU D01012]|uniref:hypothetical protein n=1 Tax=Patulibacter sp. SYSU D01012 TaxID=2817381 RepID=UPI001B30A5B8|nr:hypothetical protein [Patulibacter sp. SYSU D01012]
MTAIDPSPTSRTPGRAAAAVAGGALVLAVARELRTPRARRTWHGRVLGVVPYDLRPPTLARVRGTMWQPDRRSPLVPRAFGVGWILNLAAPLALLRRR